MDPERLLQPNPFEGDDGAISPALAPALASGNYEEIVEALAHSRVFVALFEPDDEALGEWVSEGGADSFEGEREMRQATIDVSGLHALAVFSSAEALQDFSSSARPLPLLARNAATQAFMHSGLLALDPEDEEGNGATYIGRSACAALASAQSWTPPWDDPEVVSRLRESVRIVERCIDVWVRPGRAGTVLVALQMSETSTRSDAERATVLISHALTHDEYLHARLDLVHIIPVRSV